MKIKHLAGIVITLCSITYSIEKRGLYPPYTFQHTYNHFIKLPLILSSEKELILKKIYPLETDNLIRIDTLQKMNDTCKLSSFDCGIVKFLYGPNPSTSLVKYVKKSVNNLEIFYQCEYKANRYSSDSFMVKNNYFFWEKKKFSKLKGFEKQLAEYYQATSSSDIMFFYAVNEISNENFINMTSDRYLNTDEKINHIWGIQVDKVKYCTVWTLGNNFNDKGEAFDDSYQTTIANKTENGAIIFS